MGELQKSEEGSEKGQHEREEGIAEENSEEDQRECGTSCKLFWTDLRRKRKERRVRRMKEWMIGKDGGGGRRSVESNGKTLGRAWQEKRRC